MKNMKNKWALIGILFLVFSFIGCGGDSEGGPYVPPEDPEDPWSGPTVTVTFQPNNGDRAIKQSIPSGLKVNPLVINRNYYYLTGWCSDDALTVPYDFDLPVTANITIYAKWTQTPLGSYVVKFNTNKGKWMPDIAVEDGESIPSAMQTPVRAGYAFENWYTGNTVNTKIPDIATYMVTQNVTLLARWIEPPALPEREPPSSPGNPKGRYGNFYQIFPYSWATTSTSGTRIGNFPGFLAKIDYINDTGTQPHNDAIAATGECNLSLHLDGIWFCPIGKSTSPHKYDCDDYKSIDPTFANNVGEFDAFITACKARGIRVIVDLMLNHTGINHEWFQQARTDRNSKYRTYYNFSDTKINDHWKPNTQSGGGYYEACFSDSMPDLNWNNEALKNEFTDIADYWLRERRVDGFRLDAVKHIFEIHNSTDRREDRRKNQEILKWFNDMCISKKSDVILVGEVYSGQNEVLPYIAGFAGQGGCLMSCFNFSLKWSFESFINSGTTGGFSTYVVSNYNQIRRSNPVGFDSVFIGNHDTKRFAEFVGSNPRKLRMAALVSLFAPGSPYIYYGDELGMTNGNANNDNAYRTAMKWEDSPTGTNMCTGLSTNGSFPSVATQKSDPNSLLRFYIKTINLKNRYPQIHWGQPTLIQTTGNVTAYKVNLRGIMADLAVVHNHGGSQQKVTIPGAQFLGGFIQAEGSGQPQLDGDSLTIPAYSLAVIEL